MSNNKDTKLQSAQSRNSDDNRNGQRPGNFAVGLLTFFVFILFMAVWMYFSV